MATVICPNCGGENNVTKRGGQECAYCGTMLQYPQAKRKQTKKSEESNNDTFPQAEYIIELASKYSTHNKITDELRKFLISSDNVPIDIFDHLEVKEIKWLYLPMIRYSGRVETEWSCNQVVEKKREVGQRPVRDRNGNIKFYETEYETYYDYIPKSGKGYGNFDVIIPCGKGKHLSEGLKLCYGRIDFSRISSDDKKEWPCKQIVPEEATVDTDFVDLNDNKSDIIGTVARVVRDVAEDCSFGNFGRTSDHNLSYRQSLNLNTGIVYYIPFVQVIYSYRGTNHEWVFMQSPSIRTAEPTIPEMDALDNPLEDMQALFEKQRSSLSTKETWSLILSFLLTTPIGCIIFYCCANSIIEKAKRRLNTQVGLVSLMFKLKRQANLAKHGVKAEVDHNNRDYIDDSDSNSDRALYDWSEKPTTVEGIEQYFVETEKIRKKALRKIRGFWWGLITLVLLVVGAIIGYNRWDDIQKEKMWEEEQAMIEAENKKLTDEVTGKFNAEIIGNTYEGYDLYEGKYMKLKFLDGSRLQYQLGMENGEWDFTNGARKKVNWERPKTVPYKLSVNRHEKEWDNESTATCKLEFDGYTSENILKEYGDFEFIDEIFIPLHNNERSYTNGKYHLKKK